jgi:tetratricopeptide (TPR) repeat protein
MLDSLKKQLNANDYYGALKDFTSSIELNNDLIEAIYYKGLSYFSIEKYTEAIDYFNRVIDKEPNNWDAYYYRGISNYEDVNYQDAYFDLEVFLKNDFNDIDAKELFEKVKFILDTIKAKKTIVKKNESINELTYDDILEELKMQSGLAVKVNYSPLGFAKEFQSSAYNDFENNDFENGIKSAKKALNSFISVENILLNKINKFNQENLIFIEDLYSVDLFSEELKNRQYLTRVQKSKFVYTLSYGYYLVGDFDKAIENINYSIDLVENIEFHLLRAKICLSLKQFQLCLNDINKVLDLDKNNSEALDLLNQSNLNILNN